MVGSAARPIWDSLKVTALVAVLLVLWVYLPWVAARFWLALAVVVFLVAYFLHPEFLLRRSGALLVGAGAAPKGVVFAAHARDLEGASSAWGGIEWLSGASGETMLVTGAALLVIDFLLRVVWPALRPAAVRVPQRVEVLQVEEADLASGTFRFEVDIELHKRRHDPLGVRGFSARSIFPGVKPTVLACWVESADPARPGWEAVREDAPVTRTDSTHFRCRVDVEITHRWLAAAMRTSAWLATLVRRLLFGRIGAVLKPDLGGHYPELATVVVAPVPGVARPGTTC